MGILALLMQLALVQC